MRTQETSLVKRNVGLLDRTKALKAIEVYRPTGPLDRTIAQESIFARKTNKTTANQIQSSAVVEVRTGRARQTSDQDCDSKCLKIAFPTKPHEIQSKLTEPLFVEEKTSRRWCS